MIQWLKRAFAVETPGAAAPSEIEARLVQRLAGEIVRRGLATPALLALESSRPLSFLGSQLLTFAAPLGELVVAPSDYQALTRLLERRDGVDWLARAIADAAKSRGGGP